jgi:dsDNA-specific endonuclease/ATPase MutS2
MESKKQIKAQLINEISKKYSSRIKELEDSRNALRTKIEEERKLYRNLQKKYLEVCQEFDQLKEYNQSLEDLMNMAPEERESYIENLKKRSHITNQVESILKFYNRFFLI